MEKILDPVLIVGRDSRVVVAVLNEPENRDGGWGGDWAAYEAFTVHRSIEAIENDLATIQRTASHGWKVPEEVARYLFPDVRLPYRV